MNQYSTSPRPLPVTSRGKETRERLLRAAESVFGDKGYDQTSIADIVARAEVALGTFYVYFPDKKSAFVELVDERGARLRRGLAQAVDGLTDRLEIERAGLAAFLEFIAEHPKLYRIVRQAEFVDEDAFRRYYVELARRYAAGLERRHGGGADPPARSGGGGLLRSWASPTSWACAGCSGPTTRRSAHRSSRTR